MSLSTPNDQVKGKALKPVSTAPVVDNHTIVVQPAPVKPQSLRVFVQQPRKDQPLADFSTYAPAVPGVIVALFGLYAAHKLAQWRDRDKSINEMCAELKGLADGAAESAIDAWLTADPDKRVLKVHSTKQKIQALGMAATNLHIRSEQHGRKRINGLPIAQKLKHRTVFDRRSINVIKEVSSFRRAADADPFEDPTRGADASRVQKISRALGTLTSRIDRALTDYHQ